jgi:hypothetical protein
MRNGRKALTTIAIAIFVLFALVVIREAFFGYRAYFLIVPGAEVFTDGKPSVGWLHRAGKGQVLILTRSVSGLRESYWIRRPGEKAGGVSDCGDWTAPKSPLISIGDVNPPCLVLATGPPKENRQKRSPTFGLRVLEFTADNGERLKVAW